MIWLIAAAAYVAINLAAFVAFGLDKSRAENHQRRIPEVKLLALALFSGALGALIGQQVFRHKTRKQPFRGQLQFAAALNTVVGLALLVPDVRAALFDLVVNR